MSLTKEDLQAISDLIDVKLNEQDKKFNDRFDEQDKKINDRFDEQEKRFKEMLIDNNILIAEHVQRVVTESEKRLSKEIDEIRSVTLQNSYDIAYLKQKIS